MLMIKHSAIFVVVASNVLFMWWIRCYFSHCRFAHHIYSHRNKTEPSHNDVPCLQNSFRPINDDFSLSNAGGRSAAAVVQTLSVAPYSCVRYHSFAPSYDTIYNIAFVHPPTPHAHTHIVNKL